MLVGTLLVVVGLVVMGFLLYGAYRESREEWRSWNHHGAV